MTINSTENTIENTPSQDKVEANVLQNPIDNKPEQTATENKATEEKEDPNWRAFREARKRDRSEKEAAEKRAVEKEAEVTALKAAMEAAFAKGSVQVQPQSYAYQNEYQHEETEDERIEKKVQAAIAAREAAAERARVEREQQEYPQRLAQAYPDFHNTIVSDNLDYLEYHYPEIVGPLKRLPDDFNKWADIYRAIKRFVPNATTAKKEAMRAENNFNKPKSISSAGLTQTAEGMGSTYLTEERKAANWARMQRALKGLS